MCNPHPGHRVGPFGYSVKHAGHWRLSARTSITIVADFRPSSSSSARYSASIAACALTTKGPATASHNFVPHELHCCGGGDVISLSMPDARSVRCRRLR